MLKHLEAVVSSRELRWMQTTKSLWKKKLNKFKWSKINCQRKPQGQIGKTPELLHEKGRKQNRSSLFFYFSQALSQICLATPERTRPSQAPSVLVRPCILGQNLCAWTLITKFKLLTNLQLVFSLFYTHLKVLLWGVLGISGKFNTSLFCTWSLWKCHQEILPVGEKAVLMYHDQMRTDSAC